MPCILFSSGNRKINQRESISDFMELTVIWGKWSWRINYKNNHIKKFLITAIYEKVGDYLCTYPSLNQGELLWEKCVQGERGRMSIN